MSTENSMRSAPTSEIPCINAVVEKFPAVVKKTFVAKYSRKVFLQGSVLPLSFFSSQWSIRPRWAGIISPVMTL